MTELLEAAAILALVALNAWQHRHHERAMSSDRSDTAQMVTVPREALKLLYECAKEYDVRIPREGHNLWAAPFFELFETDEPSRKEAS